MNTLRDKNFNNVESINLVTNISEWSVEGQKLFVCFEVLEN